VSEQYLVLIGVALAAGFGGWTLLHFLDYLLLVQKKSLDRAAGQTLAELFIFVDPEHLRRISLLSAVVVPLVLYALTRAPVLPVAAFIAILVMPKVGVAWLKKRRNTKFESQLPDALLMLSGAMRAGASFNTALESMVKEQKPPLSQEFDLMVREQRLGVDLDTALKHMEVRIPLQDFMMVVAAMRISREVGGNLAEILESLANTLRRKNEMEGKIRALTGQGKMQGIVMSALPMLMLLVLTKMEPKAMEPLFTTWYGWVTMAIILVAETLGYIVISKIVNIDV
jgi:tight adherence protein B